MVYLGCGGDPAGPGSGPTENLGSAVTSAGEVAEQSILIWSVDGTEVLYESRDPADVLRAVRVSDGTIRDVSVSPTRHVQFALSPDGQYIYRARESPSLDDQGLILDRFLASGGPIEPIAHNVTMWGNWSFAMAPISPDGSTIAYATVGEDADPMDATIGTRDTLFILDLTSGARTAVDFGIPLAFSPDGARLVFDRRPCDESGLWSNPCDTFIIDFRTGITEQLPTYREDGFKTVWWNESGIQYLTSSHEFGGALTEIVRNLTSGAVFVAHTLVLGQERSHPAQWTPCPDGTRVGGWTDHFNEGFQGYHVADLEAATSWLAVVNRSAEGWHSAFSPDCSQIAYTIGSAIYVSDL